MRAFHVSLVAEVDTPQSMMFNGNDNYWLLALWVFLAMGVTYAALDLTSRAAAAHRWVKLSRLMGGVTVMGAGTG